MGICSTPRAGFTCQAPPLDCPPGWVRKGFPGIGQDAACYKYLDNAETWNISRSKCAAENELATLAVLESTEELDYVTGMCYK